MKKTLLITFVAAALVLQASGVAANLVINGDFETPVVSTDQKWDIFDSGTTGLGWSVEWAGDYGAEAPDPAHLELHAGVNGWLPEDGDQYAELDTDWDGPGGSMNNEQASVRIYQDIETCEGGKYELIYSWSPRPNQSDNAIKVYWGGSLIGTHSASGGSNTNWKTEVVSDLTPAGATTTLAFVETGNPDSLGMFLDSVSVEQTSSCDYEYSCEDGFLHTDARSNEADLYLIDPITGTGGLKLTYQGDYRNTLAANSSGVVYAINRSNGHLVILESDGSVTDVGATPFGSTAIGTLGFAPDDKLYVALNNDTIWEISTADGSSTKLVDLGITDVQGGDIVIDEENFVVIVNTSGEVYTIDMAAGYTENLAGTLPAGGTSYTGMVLIDGVYYVTSQNSNSLYSFTLDPFTPVDSAYGHMFDSSYAPSGDSAYCSAARGEASINIVKSVDGPTEVYPGEEVTYIYTVTNSGELSLNNVSVSDDKCSPVTGPEGDTNGNSKLDIGEVWVYECTTALDETTINIGTATAKDPFGDPVSDDDSITVTVREPGCTVTQGYWKTHSKYGPAPYDEDWGGKEDSLFFLNDLSYYNVLWTQPKKGNAYYILAHQYIAALLNNAYMPPEVTDAMDDAESLFGTYEPAEIGALKGNDPLRKEFIELAGILGDYNEGLIGPGHCSE